METAWEMQVITGLLIVLQVVRLSYRSRSTRVQIEKQHEQL